LVPPTSATRYCADEANASSPGWNFGGARKLS
jgi:hypothetical protein